MAVYPPSYPRSRSSAIADGRSGLDRPLTPAQIGDEWIDQTFAWLAGTIDRWLQPTGDALANGLAIETELAGDRRDRQTLSMKIKNHDDFSKLDHRSLFLGRAGLGDRFAAPPQGAPRGSAARSTGEF